MVDFKCFVCRSAKECALQDLPETYEKVKSAVEEGSQLDEQFVSALRPGPKLKESVLVANNPKRHNTVILSPANLEL